MFELWHRLREGALSRTQFQEHMAPIREEVGVLLRQGRALPHDKTRRTCENILKLESALWTFVSVEGVEPTRTGQSDSCDGLCCGADAVLVRRVKPAAGSLSGC